MDTFIVLLKTFYENTTIGPEFIDSCLNNNNYTKGI